MHSRFHWRLVSQLKAAYQELKVSEATAKQQEAALIEALSECSHPLAPHTITMLDSLPAARATERRISATTAAMKLQMAEMEQRHQDQMLRAQRLLAEERARE